MRLLGWQSVTGGASKRLPERLNMWCPVCSEAVPVAQAAVKSTQCKIKQPHWRLHMPSMLHLGACAESVRGPLVATRLTASRSCCCELQGAQRSCTSTCCGFPLKMCPAALSVCSTQPTCGHSVRSAHVVATETRYRPLWSVRAAFELEQDSNTGSVAICHATVCSARRCLFVWICRAL